MPIRSIENVRVGNYPYGQFANGYIYSITSNKGYAENANNINIDIVYQKGTPIELPTKSLTTSYRIQIGSMVFPTNYFIKHSKSIAVNEETISCTFVDNSIILDKYFVGLTNRHFKVKKQNQVYAVNVNCANCDSKIVETPGYVSRPGAVSPNSVIGNLLVVGDEEFVDQTCDIPDVKYNFTDLLKAMKEIPNFTFSGFKDINDHYRTSYTGTLREVLSNWGSDFGFSFYWDSIKDTLVCIDLRSPVDLTPVSDFINSNFNQNSTLPISSFSEEESLEGTYQQDYIDYQLKPARTKQKEIRNFFPITHSVRNIDVQHAGGSFTDVEKVLAKFNSQAFSLLLLEDNKFQALGFSPVYNGISTYVLNTVLQNIAEFAADGKAVIWIGYHNKNEQDVQASRASTAADDIGRYYANDSSIKWNDLACSENSKYNISVSYEPQPILGVRPWERYGGKADMPVSPQGLPVYIIERNPNYRSIGTEGFSTEGCGPFYVDIDGELADQIRDAFLVENPSDLGADRYRGMTLIAYKPYLRVDPEYNVTNTSEELLTPAQYQLGDLPECQTICEKDSNSEICRKTCSTLATLAHGLVSRSSTAYTFTNIYNKSTMTIVLPSTQNYLGFAKEEGTFSYVEPGVIEINQSNFIVDDRVMNYSVSLNDVTTDEPSLGVVQTVKQNSNDLSVIQSNEKKAISLKIIGTNYGSLTQYLTPQAGLTNFNVYLTDNGSFTDLTFESRPAKKPNPEVIMQRVGPQKIRIVK
jgi:hypothetical protein